MPRTGLRPHVWRSGSDPINHRLYTDCQRARAQARFRGEEWTITEEEYVALWRKDDRYLKKGRTRESLCMTMQDSDLGWHLDNVEFITRIQHFQQCNHSKTGVPRNGRRKEKARA
jgi:hypothetical protein